MNFIPAEVLRQVRALMREGKSESSAYSIAVAQYSKRHGHAPRMHQKQVIFFPSLPMTYSPGVTNEILLKNIESLQRSVEKLHKRNL